MRRFPALLLAGTIVAACSGGRAPPILANGDLEAGDDLGPWKAARNPGYEVVIDSTVTHGGRHSLRIGALADTPRYEHVLQSVPVAGPARVSLRAHVKTRDAGGAAIWARARDADHQPVAFAHSAEPVKGTRDWTAVELTVDVPPGARTVEVGATLSGAGQAWFDDLAATVAVIPSGTSEPTMSLAGIVVDADGRPLGGATVALVRPSDNRPTMVVRSGPDGRVTLTAAPDRYGITATAPDHAAAYLPTRPLDARTSPITITLGGRGLTVRGHAGEGVPAGAVVLITRTSDSDSDVFAVPIAPDGTYVVELPTWPRGYEATVRDPRAAPTTIAIAGEGDQTKDLETRWYTPAPAEVLAWVRANAVPLAGVAAGAEVGDSARLDSAVGEARVVALGEATHGSRELFQLKHRLLAWLVEHHGFTVFAIEASWPDALAINDYVLHGTGDAGAALAGLGFWTWKTEEVLDLITWMRTYNASPEHARKVQFAGFDMQSGKTSLRALRDYLGAVEPALVPTLPADDGDLDDAKLRPLEDRFAAARDAWISARGEDAYALAGRHLGLLRQVQRLRAAGRRSADVRDEAMADNVVALLAQQPPGTRVVLWAHNAHVTADATVRKTMGVHLRERLGAAYLAVGFVFREGGFRALDQTKGKTGGLLAFTLGPASDLDVSAAFAAAGHTLAAVDLRRLPPAGPVTAWFAAPHPMREVGSVYRSEEQMISSNRLAAAFDVVLYVARTTPSRGLD